MMDKNREAFEAEYSKVMGAPITVLRNLRRGESYTEDRLDLSWLMWKASRQAIEVELPTKLPEEELTNLSYNLGLEHAAVAIKYVGIRVKGNEE